nr:HAD family phosphatase [Clostridia bacterium]
MERLGKRGIPVTDEYVKAVTSMGFQEAAEYTVRRYGLAQTVEEIIDEWKRMCRKAYGHSVLLKPYAKETLLRLRRSGIKLGVATALSPDLFVPALERNGVHAWFDAFASLQEVQRGKGFPDIYLLAAQRLDAEPSRCMVFEDILAGILGAKSGGFQTCGVYDESSAHDWEKICAAADRTLVSFEADGAL